MALPTAHELQAKLAALQHQERATAALIAALQDYEAVVGNSKERTPEAASSTNGRRSAPAMEATEAVAIQLMEQKQGPVATAQIVEEMRKQGVELPPNNTNNVISARLSNSSKFQGRRGHGYWFSDRPWPPGENSNFLSDPVKTGPDEDNEIDA